MNGVNCIPPVYTTYRSILTDYQYTIMLPETIINV